MEPFPEVKLLKEAKWYAAQLGERRRLLRGNLAILMYHRVSGPGDHAFLRDVPAVSPDVFREQLRFLAEHGFRVLSLPEALDRLENRERFERKSVVITFDDGYLDNLTVAAPALASHGFPATVFVATDVLPRDRLLLEHRAYVARDRIGEDWLRQEVCEQDPRIAVRKSWLFDALVHLPPDSRGELDARLGRALADAGIDEASLARDIYLSPADVTALGEAGVEVASHGASHVPFATLDDDGKRAEIETARAALGRDVAPLFCYPYGSHDRSDGRLLAELGFRGATTVEFGTNGRRADPFRLRRISLGDTSWHRLRFLDRAASIADKLDGFN